MHACFGWPILCFDLPVRTYVVVGTQRQAGNSHDISSNICTCSCRYSHVIDLLVSKTCICIYFVIM